MTTPADESPEVERQTRAIRRFLRSFYSANSYGSLLVMILATYALAVTVRKPWAESTLLIVQIATVWLALRTSLAHRPLRIIANVLFVLAAISAVANLVTSDDTDLQGTVFLAASLLYCIAPVSIIRHLAFRREIDEETMLGALAAYLMLGMAFAMAYRCIGALQNGPFFGLSGEGTLSDDLFFSFITLTTTGYGNLVPAKNPGQSLAVVEALLGQLFLVTAVAKVVNAWTPRRWSATPGEPDENS